MYKFKKSYLMITGLLFILPQFLFLSCNKNDIPQSTLELRDSLIYKKGETRPFTGHEKARIEDKIIEYDVVNGIKQVDFKLYFLNGNLQIEGWLKDNKNVGEWKYYYNSGELESQGEFANDKPKGEWTWYYPSGTVKERGNYFEGKRIGKWQQFDERGRIINEKEFSLQDSINNVENHFKPLNRKKNNN